MENIKESLWNQFGASMDMLKNAITTLPDAHWDTDKKFFYNAYHCLIFLDYYLSNPPSSFSPFLDFTIAEPDAVLDEGILGDIVPNRLYTKQDFLEYLALSREKCHNLIQNLTAEQLKERWIEDSGETDPMNYSLLEILLYNMRHVQHHTAQLNLLLRQKYNDAPKWVFRVDGKY